MIVMGKIVAAQGLQGWVKVQPYTEFHDALIEYQAWFLGSDAHGWREVKVQECRTHTKVLVAKLDGINDRNAAEKYKGLLIAIPRSSLPSTNEDEFYWSDLIGLQVENLEGVQLGVVDHLLDMGANDILCVLQADVEILIPFISSVIKEVNLGEKLIRVDWQADY